LACVWVTLSAQHPEHGPAILDYIRDLDLARLRMYFWYARVLGGNPLHLWTPGDLDTILAGAEPVPDPKRG